MGAMATQITSVSIVYPTAYSGADQTVAIAEDIISVQLWDLRQLDVSLNNSLAKFRKLGGYEGRNSKYVYAISSVQAYRD